MAQQGPKTRKELAGCEGINDRLIDRYGKNMLACVEKASAVPEENWPHFPRAARSQKDPQAERILAKLKKWRLDKAAEFKLDPGVLINNAQLEVVSRLRPTKLKELEAIKGLRQWQISEMGSELVALVG